MENINESSLHAIPSPKGRRFSRQQRRQLLKSFEQSGLTQRQFAVREKIGLSTLSKWVRQQHQAAARSEPVTFQELMPSSSGPHWAAEVISPRNWTLRLARTPEPVVLQHLLRALPC